jgi:hypothetical protein
MLNMFICDTPVQVSVPMLKVSLPFCATAGLGRLLRVVFQKWILGV